MPRFISVTDDSPTITITSENIMQYCSGDEYLAEGLYEFVGNDTFFRTYIPVAASSLETKKFTQDFQVAKPEEVTPGAGGLRTRK